VEVFSVVVDMGLSVWVSELLSILVF
jgi:hypothetical protein